MNLDEHINHWINGAERDLTAAENLYNAGNYDWCLFIGHLVLEKTLKAIYIKENGELAPPKIHDLVKLAKKSNIQLSDERIYFLSKVNDFHIEARYSEYKSNFYKICNAEYAAENFTKIKEYFEWLKSLLK